MYDAWVAECLPCKWQELHKTEDGAIGAAEEHVFAAHRKVPSAERGRLKMGHVMSRTIAEPQDTPVYSPEPAGAEPEPELAPGPETPGPDGSAVQQIQRATDDFLGQLNRRTESQSQEG